MASFRDMSKPEHDPRIIANVHNVTGGSVQIQCLKCGSVFREAGYKASQFLINCAVEKRHRADLTLDHIPMMVTPDSEKYDPSS